MFDFLFWLYLVNAVLLIDHEIDSAYWKEWDLFRLPGGVTGFLILHLPLIFIVCYGLIPIHEQAFSGLIFSSILSASGLFAFTIHTVFIKKGRREFRVPFSISLLVSSLIISLIQAAVTIYLFLD